ncbi:hypothetical protein AB0M50_32235 [Nonomuraea fuscirosea]|uniref:hypothetical protein n=1 Tax=Nonomuraea fuscirosea TaxID=1291556 RepID=UPI00341D0CE4
MPGAPPWEPPPAFTAAAAGMPVWPAPLSDPHAVPPWPAATGELVAEPDSDEPGQLPTPFDASATQPEGLSHPAHHFDPDATQQDATRHLHADDTPPDGIPAPGHPGAADHPGTGTEGHPGTPPSTALPHDRQVQDPPDHDGRTLTQTEHDRAASSSATHDRQATQPSGHTAHDQQLPDHTAPGGHSPESAHTTPTGHAPGSPHAVPGDHASESAHATFGGQASDSAHGEQASGRPEGFAGHDGPEPADTVPGGLRPGITVPGRATPEGAHPGDPRTTDPHPFHDQAPGQGPGQGVGQGSGQGSGQGPGQGAEHGLQGPGSKPSKLPHLPAPIASTRDTTAKPAHYFDPNAAKTESAASQNPPFDPSSTNPSVRPPEPGDVPVWPPNSPTGDKLPELPFSRDTWGHKPSTSFDLPKPPAGGPAFPPGAFKQPPFQTPPPPPPPPRSKRALLVTLGALALAGVATGGFFAVQAMNSAAPPPVAASPAPTSPSVAEESAVPPADLAGTSMLDSEQSDPQKLSLSEAFPKKKVSAAGTTFTRVKAHMETTCDKAATGAFADALKEQKCSRVLRATYVDSKRRYAVTTGLAVLPDKNAAATVDQAKDLSRNVWFRPLPGASGSGGERVHIAGGYAAGLVWGRYIVFSYATYADGHTPTAKEKTLPKVSGAFRDQITLVLERRITKG